MIITYTKGEILTDEEATYKIADILRPFISAILFFPNRIGTPNQVITNGTVCFFNSGEKKFMVTNNHVIEEFEKIKSTNTNAVFILSGAGFETQYESIDATNWKIIDREKNHLDLITIEIPHDIDLTKHGKKMFSPSTWLTERIVKDEVVCFLGYPGELREFTDENMDLSLMVGVLNCTTVNERGFTIVDENNERKVYKFDQAIDTSNLKTLGGMSGTPVFTQRNGDFEIKGIIYESNDEGALSNIYCVHFDYIQKNGTIDRLKIPFA